MNALKLFPVAAFALLTVAGCSAEQANGDGSSDSDIQAANGTVTGANAQALMDLLMKVNAPSNQAPGMLGVGGRVARLELDTAQGGMAHYISQSGQISSLEGADLGTVLAAGADWGALEKALEASGMKWDTKQGDHGASSSRMFAKVDCSQVVAPNAKPTCTVTPIVITEADAQVLMNALMKANAPSDIPAGMLGVGGRVARFTLTTAQGGMAHFISEGLSVATLDGKQLADLGSLATAWADAEGALLDGGSVWKTVNGDHGATLSTIVATVECRQVVAPSAKPTCTVMPEQVK
jgi:hypothetical protein